MTTWWDTDYPDALREIAEPPPLIFYRGDITALERRGVGIVGTRKPTPGGVAFARRLGRELSLAGVPVISGLARGIDTAAHAGSLGGPGAAVAVIGTGIDVVYPQENAELMVDIARSGCVMTEQLMGRTPTAFVFPRRNRMISGLARAVVVVEGGIKSGALITARWALEQGRDVGAVPCFPGDFRSEGPNSLIKQGAFVVEGAGDVLSAVNGLAQTVLSFDEAGDEKPRGVAAHVRRIYDSLGRTPTDLDALAETVGVAVEAVQSVLTEMEIEGLVRRDAAGRYCREG